MNLEESFALLSTMSPKLITTRKIKKKAPKFLSLKKPLRRSSILYDKNESPILVEESSSETVSTLSRTSAVFKKNDINNSIIVISDSESSVVTIEDSFSVQKINTQKCSLSDTKYEKVAEWVSKVNSELKDIDISKMQQSLGNDLNQLLVEDSVVNHTEISIREEDYLETPDKNVEEDDCVNGKSANLSDESNYSLSLRISINEANNSAKVTPGTGTNTSKNEVSPSNKLKNSIRDSEDERTEKSVEDVLDDIYGDCWRENRDVILQQTERKNEKKNSSQFNFKKITLTDIKGKRHTPSSLCRKMPWLNSLKKVCDPDTSSSDEDNDHNKYSDIRTKLNFEEKENISPLQKKNCTTNTNFNEKYNDDYQSEDDLFDDVAQDFLTLKDRLLRKLNDNGICNNESDKKNRTPRKEKTFENNLLKNFEFDTEKDSNKKPIKRNNVKTDDKKKKNGKRNEKNDKIIASVSDSSDDEKEVKKYNKKNKKPEPKKYFEESAKQASFLSSLSGSLPQHYCDPSALIYRNNFKNLKDELAKKLFSMYNEKAFGSQISSETQIQWNDRMRGSAGFCYCLKRTSSKGLITRTVRIALATKILDSADRLRDTMIHEMCHAASWVIDGLSDGHGPVWRKWAQKAMSVFPELPPIKRCHNYKINTKYTYRCTGCGYSIGRHSKSLDIERKRCGYCLGVFEILINKTSKSGEVQSVPVTPRKEPNAFALFVKENYAAYKTSQLKHGDVMKLLGQKFSEMKVKSTN